jgi:hypothetical protein
MEGSGSVQRITVRIREAQKLYNTKLISNLEIECKEAEIILLLARRIVRHILHHHLHRVNICVHLYTSVPSGLRIRIHFIRIQHFRLNTDPDPDPIRIQGFDDQTLKNYS